VVQVLAIAALTTGCVASQQGAASFDDVEPPAADASTIEALPRRICSATDGELLRRIAQGANQKRSGEIQLVPPESLQAGGLSHASPFDTTQQVPLLVTGDGIVRPGVYERRVTLADVAPTAADILKFPGFRAPDGSSLSEALLPAATRDAPRLIVTVIWDSAGTDLLDRWDEGWPRLRELADRSAWFTDAALDASPSNTPPSHATIGTGAFPRTHGIPDEYVRFDGRIERPLHLGPRVLRVPTLGDDYDLAMGNESLVGTVGSLSAHLLMMSRGSFVPDADEDLAVTREPKDAATGGDDSAPRWQLSEEMAPYYALPAYANDPSMDDRFLTELEALDRADGADDGRWRDHEISSLLGGWDTPARSAWQTDMVEAVIEREGFGADDVPDLLYVNYKMLDSLGHSYSADGVELLDGLRAQDRELERLVRILDERVGAGRWAMILTADHGMARDPAVTGADRYDVTELTASIEDTFGAGVVQQMRPTQIWLDTQALRAEGSSVAEVAAFLMAMPRAAVVRDDGEIERPDDPAFLAAIPTRMLGTLSCAHDPGS
jgi:Type I phosphodiesterase / nucleotide pyrophosphatase